MDEFTLLDPVALEGRPVPSRRWLVEGLMPWRSVTLLGGDGGVGKSLLCLQLQVAAALGKHWIGQTVTPVKSFGLYAEDDRDELHRRLADILKHYDASFLDIGDAVFAPRVGEDNVLARSHGRDSGLKTVPLYESLLEKCQAHGAQLVVIDTVADTFGANENYRSEVRAFIGLLRRMAMTLDGAVVLTAHPSKDGLASGSGISGSTAWHNSVRSRLYLTRPNTEDGIDPPPDRRTLHTKKANYSPANGALDLLWRDGVLVTEAEEESSGLLGSIKQNSDDNAFLEALDELHSLNLVATPHKNQDTYAPRQILRARLGKGRSLKKLEDAMYRCITDRTAKIVEIRDGGRERKVIVRADTADEGVEA